jgi:hypothetical protein
VLFVCFVKHSHYIWSVRDNCVSCYGPVVVQLTVGINNNINNIFNSTDVSILYNILYSVSTQKYISTVIQYIQLGPITATCFDRKRSSSDQ